MWNHLPWFFLFSLFLNVWLKLQAKLPKLEKLEKEPSFKTFMLALNNLLCSTTKSKQDMYFSFFFRTFHQLPNFTIAIGIEESNFNCFGFVFWWIILMIDVVNCLFEFELAWNWFDILICKQS